MKPTGLQVLFFAQTRQIANCPGMELAVAEPLTESEFWERLLAVHPGLEPLRHRTRIACNQHFLGPGDRICPGDEIALIPPVSGG